VRTGAPSPVRHAGVARIARAAPPGRDAVASSAPQTRAFADVQLQAHLGTARRVIAHGTPLLLCAETGAGKEVFARAVHAASPRADGPFVAINCASLPDTLIEAELFGYRAGAFTGAEKSGRRGKIAQSDGGTLFLDEIGDMPLALQARLLRVLDERMVTPLGTDEPRPVDFQLISASHRQLGDMVNEGTFRQDLYYRLAGIELHLPPLRERSDRASLIRDVMADEGRSDMAISPAAWDLLMTHPWPGNVRQLKHVLRSALALADGGVLSLEHLGPLSLHGGDGPSRHAAHEPDTQGLDAESILERQQLMEQLKAMRWNVSHVAKALGVSRNTLYRRMHKLRIAVTHSQ
jgi:transcriptional regulator of acetoin/glycerol metabolism